MRFSFYNIRYISLMLSTLLLWPLGIQSVDAFECGSGDYVISAYYSPVPGQARYATGTYEGDIRLNGGGVMTASGTAVSEANGPFVAAPPCMAFGTTLSIDGLGMHQVLDRGGAIKGSRLDIWMGYGDVGLTNALTWGKRTVRVEVNGMPYVENNFSFDIGSEQLANYQRIKDNDPYKFKRDLAFGDSGEDVARLQQMLKDSLYFNGKVNGIYDKNTKLAVESFNLAHGVIQPTKINEKGKFGSDSATTLKNVIIQNREKYFKDLSTRNLGRGSEGDDVKKLQEFLKALSLLDSITGIYDAETVNAVLAFQLAEGVIKSANDQGAGYFGPLTQIAFDRVANKLEESLVIVDEATIGKEEVLILEQFNNPDEYILNPLQEGAEGNEVRVLQQLLKDLHLLNVEPTGYFGPLTKHAVFKFQQRIGLVQIATDSTAGFVGPATRNALNNYISDRNTIYSKIQANVALASEKEEVFVKNLDIGMTDPDVAELQLFLRKKGYFTGKIITEYFGPMTRNALMKFKKDNNLDTDSLLLFDEETRSYVNELM